MIALTPHPHRRPSKFNLSIGHQIRHVSECLGVSARELSLRSGLRLDHLRLYQSGQRPPTCRALLKIAQGLGTSVDPLFPEISLSDPLNQALYQGFRQAWFLPVEARRLLVSVLNNLLEGSGLHPLSTRPLTLGGGTNASRP